MNQILNLQSMMLNNAAEVKPAPKKDAPDNKFKDLMSKRKEDSADAKQPESVEKPEKEAADSVKGEAKKESREKSKKAGQKEERASQTDGKETAQAVQGTMVLLSELLENGEEDPAAALQVFFDTAKENQELIPEISAEAVQAFGTENVLSAEAGKISDTLTLQSGSEEAKAEVFDQNAEAEALLPGELKEAKDGAKAETVNVHRETTETKGGADAGISEVREETTETKTEIKAERLNVRGTKAETADEAEEIQKDASVEESSEKKTEMKDEVRAENVQAEAGTRVQAEKEDVIEIKVADPYVRLNQESVEKLADKITKYVRDGKEEFEIQLNPENLGKIQVKISLMESGVKVLFNCDSQKTMQLLAERAGALNRIVEQNTGTPVQVEVKEDIWNQQKNATDQQNRRNQQQEERQKKSDRSEAEDFLHQLRLGIVHPA